MTRTEIHRLEAELSAQREFWCCVRDIACGFIVAAGILAIVWWVLKDVPSSLHTTIEGEHWMP